jgi:hypothetical protein
VMYLMSALPLKADTCGATRDVRYGPKADIRTATKWDLYPARQYLSGTEPTICVSRRTFSFSFLRLSARSVVKSKSSALRLKWQEGVAMHQFQSHFVFGRDRTSNVRQVRRTYVAHANRAGRTRLGEAYFRVSSLPKRGDRARQISIVGRRLCKFGRIGK